MITWTQGYTRAANLVGINTTQDLQDLSNIQMDINQGLRIFKNASRRYWTRAEKSANLVQNQQYYQLPPDCVRVTQVRVLSNGLNLPITEVDSEYLWNRMNLIPAFTLTVPQSYFIRGANEIGLWPTPSLAVTNGLIVSYEPRLPDMSIDDITNITSNATVTVSNGSTTVTTSSNIVTPQMVGRWFQVNDGTDGSWYQIGIYDSTNSFELTNSYQGISGGSHSFIIGQAPDIPEDYHLGPIYYACYNYFLKRGEQAFATTYKALFEDLLTQYKEVYAAKTTGQIQQDITGFNYNLFGLPPTNVTS